MTTETQEKIARLQELIAQRIEIDRQLEELLSTPPIPLKTSKGFYKKKTPKDIVVEESGKHRGFTEAEKNNIIELYKRGELVNSIAKKFQKTPTVIYQFIHNQRKLGVKIERTTTLEEIVNP